MIVSKAYRLGLGGQSNRLLLVATSAPCSSKRLFSIDQIGKRYEKPYDYNNKQYGFWGTVTDSTLRKLGENSLIVSIEGNFGSGKSKLAEKLAKSIDFVQAREPCLQNHIYTTPHGIDMRKVINEFVGDNMRFQLDSIEDWHVAPSFKRAIVIQHCFYIIRWMQMRTALLHLMSTGQGVVLERSVFSDSVIAQALYDNHMMTDEAWRFYLRDVLPNTLLELWRPHVVIYIDKSPEDCLETIKRSGKDHEKNSKVYTLDFLRSVDQNYKKNFLPSARNNMHVLTYSSDEATVETIMEDLELLDFDDGTKFIDWRIRKETIINTYRKSLANYEHCIDIISSPIKFTDVAEYFWYGEELQKLDYFLKSNPEYNVNSKAGLFTLSTKRNKHRNWL